MPAAALPIPGIFFGTYPEQRTRKLNPALQLTQCLLSPRKVSDYVLRKRFAGVLRHFEAANREELNAYPMFKKRVDEVRARLGRDGFTDELVAASFTLIANAVTSRLGYRLFETQMYAAWLMLQNRLAEMATGEGKTVAASLTVATAALAGIPVHVITANDYLVQRDAQLLQPVYETLGLSVGFVTQSMNEERRREAYAKDITYCTAKELVFDYLRDGMARRNHSSELHARASYLTGKTHKMPVLRGLCMAVVDEADSIFIDEARTPLILSQAGKSDSQAQFYTQALQFALQLTSNLHYRLHPVHFAAELTESGRSELASRCQAMHGAWKDRRRREEVISLALAAQHLFKRDKHYLVRDDKVLLVDQTTGRAAPGRIFSRGVHQLLEVKEGVAVTGDQHTIAQITYQRFFPRYHRLCGMSGTLQEARTELAATYGLRVSGVPLRRPSRRERWPLRVFATAEQKYAAVVQRVAQLHELGRPVLIGTDSVADSERLAAKLHAAGLQPQVLNARHDSAEADIVAAAGSKGAVTVATNMAGRGTDIPLGVGVGELGGLHVISCQRNASRRIDRQLHGRCARQGDPGSFETMLTLDEGRYTKFNRRLPQLAARIVLRESGESALTRLVGGFCVALSQRVQEMQHQFERWQLLRQDRLQERRLSFTGQSE